MIETTVTTSSATDAAPAVPGATSHAHTPLVEIKPSSGWRLLNLRELWEFRDLLLFLTWRDVKVRYTQTALGVTWVLLQPLLTTLVFTIFFGGLADMPTDGKPKIIFYFCGLLPWSYFTYVLGRSSSSLVANQNLIKKVYFPRILIPLSTVLDGLVDFVVTFAVLLVMMLWLDIPFTWRLIALVPLLMLTIGVAVGVGLWLSTLNVQYRDVRYIVPFITQFWMFLSPIAYPASLIPETYRLPAWLGEIELPVRMLYGLNPMAGVVEGFRWAVLDTEVAMGPMFWLSVVMTGLLLFGGIVYFRRMERRFADVV